MFGARNKENILYYDDTTQLEKDLPRFKYHIILSKESWGRNQGYAHTMYEPILNKYFKQIKNGSYNNLGMKFFFMDKKK